jgi:putative transposase
VSLVTDAERDGARRSLACAEAAISNRTLQRLVREGGAHSHDRRRTARRSAPSNKLSEEEREALLAVANSSEFASLPPGQIVPALADRSEYIASESTLYRTWKAVSQQHHRGRS